jgi:hypothetical protein
MAANAKAKTPHIVSANFVGPSETRHRLLTTDDVAALLSVAPKTVVWWRSQKQGPAWVRLGRGRRAPIRYRPEAIENYIACMESAGA